MKYVKKLQAADSNPVSEYSHGPQLDGPGALFQGADDGISKLMQVPRPSSLLTRKSPRSWRAKP